MKKVFRGSVLEINVKSFLGLITLHLENGDSLTVRAVGDDCEEALEEVAKFFSKAE
ncbi:MAG: HPr family phosphocarrier protein [Bacillus sp. (in: Bacteria)]|nr:HPr family phosphocarrier protein [Bacillus sp. (in: firmicutes)]